VKKQKRRVSLRPLLSVSEARSLVELVSASIDELESSPKNDYLKQEWRRKLLDGFAVSAPERASAALNKWLQRERLNEQVNARLCYTIDDPSHVMPGLAVSCEQFFTWCRSFISRLIGDVPSMAVYNGSFSGGASVDRNRNSSSPAEKFNGQCRVTPELRDWLLSEEVSHLPTPLWRQDEDFMGIRLPREHISGSIYHETSPYLARDSVFSSWVDVGYNVFFTVDKNAEIDRCACKEPEINMYYQKGAGDYIRRRLKRAGIDLNDQSNNRNLAQIGSASGDLATIDLSSASDSVTRELVRGVLPDIWFCLLDTLRCANTLLPDKSVHRNEMFSSMGNGFMFELETLVFFALARATAFFTGTRGVISVYGDDIIVPSVMAGRLISVLSYCGFQTNESKTFVEGPFRESCGGHFYNGTDITPFYVQEVPTSYEQVISLGNKIRRWMTLSPVGGVAWDPELYELWDLIKGTIPHQLHGGHDPSVDQTLCCVSTLDIGHRKRVVAQGTPKSVDHRGCLSHWLSSTCNRDQLGHAVQTSRVSRSNGERLKSLPSWYTVAQPTVLLDKEWAALYAPYGAG